MDFDVTVVSRAAVSAAGLSVRTSAENASRDCPRLWQEGFAPRMAELGACGAETYGVCVAVPGEGAGCCAFDYYAALPWPADKPLPQGFARVEMPEGLYAECQVPSLERIGDAYTYMCRDWPARHPDYALAMHSPSCEFYPCDWLEHGRLTLYIPVQRV